MTETSSYSSRSGSARGGLAGWFIDNPVAANLLMAILLIGGALTAAGLRSEEFPTLEPRTISVSVVFPGASPRDVEDGVNRRLEEALLGVDGVERVRSTAEEGSGSLSLDLAPFADTARVRADVETAVDSVAAFLPVDAEAPVIRTPLATGGVVTLAVLGNVSPLALKQEAERLERNLLSTPGVALVSLTGARAYEIAIEIDEATLQRYSLSFDDIANAVRAGSVDLSGGEVRASGGDIFLRTEERRETVDTFETIVIRTEPDGRRLLLADVATITDGFVRNQLSNTVNGKPAVFIDISRSASQDVIAVKRAVDRFLTEYQPAPGVEIVEFRDETASLRDRINLIFNNGAFGFVLVLIFLVLVVDLRLAFWISIGIASAFIGGFLLSSLAGVSFNAVSLFGLLIVIGLVVDDAIVVGEAIDEAKAQGLPPREAALKGLQSVRAPVFVGVATTIGAFAPLLVSSGGFAEVTRQIPVVVIATLLVSIIEAFFILPSHLAHGGAWSRPPLSLAQHAGAAMLATISRQLIRPLAQLAANMRYATLAVGIATIFIAFSLLGTGTVRFIFFPVIEPDTVTASLDLPEGAPFTATAGGVAQLETAAKQVAAALEDRYGTPVIRSIVATTGGRASGGGGPGAVTAFTAAENIGRVQLDLIPSGARAISAGEIEQLWRNASGRINAAETLSFSSSFVSFGADISYDLAADAEADLFAAVADFRAALEGIEGVRDIDDTIDLGKRELLFTLTDAGEASGLTIRGLARQVRQAFFGEEVDRLQRGREEVRVFVRYPDRFTSSLDALDRMRVRLPNGGSAALRTVAKFEESRASSRITRVDGRRVLSVSADVDETITTPGAVNARIITDILPGLAERYPGLRWTIAGAAEEQNEDLAGLGRSFLIVLVVIYAIVAVQLRSYLLPAAILLAAPIAAAGAIFGHYALGYPVSFVSIFGIVALAGVSVNASIVLIDDYLKRRANGAGRIDAAADATARRFRPVLLTTLTTTLGLAPILSETSPQAQFLIPLAVSLGGGILVSGLLVLFVTPATALIIEDIAGLVRRTKLSPTSHTSTTDTIGDHP